MESRDGKTCQDLWMHHLRLFKVFMILDKSVYKIRCHSFTKNAQARNLYNLVGLLIRRIIQNNIQLSFNEASQQISLKYHNNVESYWHLEKYIFQK